MDETETAENEWATAVAEMTEDAAPEPSDYAAEAAETYAAETGAVLPLCFLATPAEAAAETALREELLGAAEPEIKSTRRSRREKEPVQLTPEMLARRARNRFRAKLIVYGGTFFFTIAVAVLASYKLPKLLWNQYIWPWTLIVSDTPPVQDDGPDEDMYKMPDGTMIPVRVLNDIEKKGYAARDEIEKLFNEGQQLYDQDDIVHAAVKAKLAVKNFDGVMESMDKYKSLTKFHLLFKSLSDLRDDIGFKAGQWPKQLTANQVDEYHAALKEAGLGDGGQENSDNGGDASENAADTQPDAGGTPAATQDAGTIGTPDGTPATPDAGGGNGE